MASCALSAINVGINNNSASSIRAINAGKVDTSKEIVGNKKVLKNGKEISDSNYMCKFIYVYLSLVGINFVKLCVFIPRREFFISLIRFYIHTP